MTMNFKLNRILLTLLLLCLVPLSANAKSTGVFGQEEGQISGDIFGQQKRYVHTSIGLSTQYTDNLYNTNTDEVSDVFTVVSPVLAFSVPGSNEVNINMNIDTASPGGLSLSRDKLDTTDKYQAFLIYNPKAELYKDNNDENIVTHTLKGAAKYKMPMGLTIDVADQFSKNQEMRGETGDRNAEEYKDNLLSMLLEYEISPKLTVKTDLSMYNVDYSSNEADFRDRKDKSGALSVGFKISPKTEIFAEYKRIDVAYDSDTVRDSYENIYSGGMNWQMTAKSRGKFKIGYAEKKFDSNLIKDADNLDLELDLTHKLTPKTTLQAGATRSFYESNLDTANYYVADRLDLKCSQEMTPLVTTSIEFMTGRDDYKGSDTDATFVFISPSMKYSPLKWLGCEAGYSFETKFSKTDVLEYATRTFYLNIQAMF